MFYGKCRYIYYTWMLWVCTGNLLRGSFLNMNLWFFRTAHFHIFKRQPHGPTVFTSSTRLRWSILHPKQKTALFSTSTSHPAPSTRFFWGGNLFVSRFPRWFRRWPPVGFGRRFASFAKVHQTSGSQTRRDHRLGLTFCWFFSEFSEASMFSRWMFIWDCGLLGVREWGNLSTFTGWYIGDETEPSFPTGRARPVFFP